MSVALYTSHCLIADDPVKHCMGSYCHEEPTNMPHCFSSQLPISQWVVSVLVCVCDAWVTCVTLPQAMQRSAKAVMWLRLSRLESSRPSWSSKLPMPLPVSLWQLCYVEHVMLQSLYTVLLLDQPHALDRIGSATKRKQQQGHTIHTAVFCPTGATLQHATTCCNAECANVRQAA